MKNSTFIQPMMDNRVPLLMYKTHLKLELKWEQAEQLEIKVLVLE